MQRRQAGQPGREGMYVGAAPDGTIPEVVHRWQREVHIPGIYDLEVDSSTMTPEEIAEVIDRRFQAGPPTAFERLASRR